MKQRPRRDDYFAQLLRANGDPTELDRILQDKCRRKAAQKLAATLSYAPSFRFPTELSAEQCTADEIAEFHASLIEPGSKVIDLTAGLGIDVFHIARKACNVLAIEMNPEVEAAIESNARALGLDNVSSHCGDCRDWLTNCREHYDIAFIDPARRADDGARIYSLTDCRPNVIAMLDDIERTAPRLIVKASPMLDISRTIGELRNVRNIYAVGNKSECKELLIDIDFKFRGTAEIHAVTVGERPLTLHEPHTRSYAEDIPVGSILGEPWPAVMKIQPRGQFEYKQLHPDTLLFLDPDDSFPGKRYLIERVEDFSSSMLKQLAREGVTASIATRNFPIAAETLRKRLKAKEDSSKRLIATTIYPNKQKLLFLSAKFANNS